MKKLRIVEMIFLILLLSFSLSALRAQQQGGELTFAAESMGDTLENGIWTGFGSINVLDNIGEGLTRSNFTNGEPMPGLAESWEISEDQQTYTFTLREDALFHDGTPVTADAVVRSLTRNTNTVDPSFIDGLYMFPSHGTNNWQSITALDDRTVEIVLSEPDATQLHTLSRPSAYIISPTALDEQGVDIGLNPVMAGPFKLERFVPGQEAVLVPFEDYYGGRPFLDRVIIRAFPDEASILAAVEAGEVDFTTSAPFLSANRLDASENIRVEVGPPLVDLFVGANVGNPPLDNLNIRLAVNYAINRDNIILAGLDGFADLPASILTPRDLGFDPSGREISTHNPDRARELIAESGIETPIPIELAFENNRFWPQLAELIKADLEAVGFAVTLDRLDTGSFWGKVFDGATQLSINQRSTFIPDPHDKTIIVHSVKSPGGQTFHELLPTAEQLDSLIDAGIAVLDPEERAQIYRDIQALLLEQMPYTYLGYLTPPVFVAEKVQGVPVDGAAAGRVNLAGVWIDES